MRLICLVVVCVLTTTAVPVIAQEQAWFWAGSSLTQLGISNGGRDWGLVDRITLPAYIPTSKPIAAGGGRYIVWTVQIPGTAAFTDSVLVWFDTRTRQASYLPSVTLHGQVTLGVDRRHGRLVVLDQSAVYLLTPGDYQITTIPFPAEGNEQRSLAVARGGLFIGRRRFRQFYSPNVIAETVVLDASTGYQLGIIADVWEGHPLRDERELVFTKSESNYIPGLGYGYDVEAWSTEPLTQLSQHDDAWSLLGSRATLMLPQLSRLTVLDDVLIASWYSPDARGLHVRGYDARSFALGFDADYPGVFPGRDSPHLFHASSRAPYIMQTTVDDLLGCSSTIRVIERPYLDVVRWFSPKDFGIPCMSTLLMLAPPDAPTGLRATVSRGSVTLEWDPPPDIGDYEIEAGSAPGLRNIGVFRTGGKSFATFADVPAGTYYVRVRAINELGVNHSAEIRVIVP